MAVDFGTGFVRILPDLAKFGPQLKAGVTEAGNAVEAQVKAQLSAVSSAATTTSTQVSTAVQKSAAKSAESWDSAAAQIRAAAESLTTSVVAPSEAAAVAVQATSNKAVAATKKMTEAQINAAKIASVTAKEVSTQWLAAGDASGQAFRVEFEKGFAGVEGASFAAANRAEERWIEAGFKASRGFSAAFEAQLVKVSEAGAAAAAKLETEFVGVRGALTGLFTGAIAIGGLDIATRGAVEYSHALLQISSSYNVTTAQAAEFKAMADEVGVRVETVLPTFARLTKAAGDTGSSISQALDRWGISAENFRNADFPGQLAMLAKGYEEAGDKQKQFVSDILGGRGTRIAPLFASYKELNEIVSHLNFPIPSHEDIFAMMTFQIQMQNLVRTIELKVIPVAVKLKNVIIALLAVWAAQKVWGLLRSLALGAEAAMGKLSDTVLYLRNRDVELTVANEELTASEIALRDASIATGKAFTAQLASMAKFAGVATAVVIGIGDIVDAVKGAHESFKDLGISGALEQELQDLAKNEHSLASRFGENILGFITGKGPNRAIYDQAASEFGDTVSGIMKKGLDEADAKSIAQEGVEKALATGVGLMDPAVQKWIDNLVKIEQKNQEVAKSQLDLAAAVNGSTKIINDYAAVIGESIDLKSDTVLQDAANSYAAFRDSVASNLNFVIGDLQTLADMQGLTAEGIARHLDLQMREMATFADNLSTIASDGSAGAKELAKQLESMGTAGYNMAYKIAHASPAVREHIENDIGQSLTDSQDAASKLEEQLVGGFNRIAAAILFATGKVKSFPAALKEVASQDFEVKVPEPVGYGTNHPSSHYRAQGGSIEPNVPYVVGENGPEVFRSGVRGDIIPSALLGSGRDRVEIVISNWETGKGYMRYLARDDAAGAETYQSQLARMGRPR